MAKMSPLEDGEGPKGLLLLITPESDVMGRMDAARRARSSLPSAHRLRLFACGCCSLVPSASIGIFLSPSVTVPVERMPEAASRLAVGDLNPTDKEPAHWIHQLAGCFHVITRQQQPCFKARELHGMAWIGFDGKEV